MKILNIAKESIDWKARIYALCQKDIFFFINTFCWTKDPRPNVANVIPIQLYEFQENLILTIKSHIEKGEDLLIEKSRDMGVTWCFLYTFLWFWLFGSGHDFLLGSQTQDDVDQSGNPKSLFPRIRINLRKFPSWLMPNNYQDNFLRLINHENNCSIIGEANTINFSRQGRFSAIMFDEFAVWSESGRKNSDEQAWTAAGDASPCRFAISSAKGKSNYFYKLRSGDIGHIKVKTLHWKLHPNKNQEWYDSECQRRSKAEIAQELDIDYAASVTNKAFENWNPAIHIINNGRFKYTLDLPLDLTCDFNIDPMCWSIAQNFGARSYTFKEYTEQTTITENVITKFVRDFKDHKAKTIYVYGDASGKYGSTRSRESDYDIIVKVLKANSWYVIMQVGRQNPPIHERLNSANKRLSDWEHNGEAFEFVDQSCKKMIESIEQTQRKDDGIDKDGSEHHSDNWSYRIYKKYPVIKRVGYIVG